MIQDLVRLTAAYLFSQHKERNRLRGVFLLGRIVVDARHVLFCDKVQQCRRHEREQSGEAAQEDNHRHAAKLVALLDEHRLHKQTDAARCQRKHFDRADFRRQRAIVNLLRFGGVGSGWLLAGIADGTVGCCGCVEHRR